MDELMSLLVQNWVGKLPAAVYPPNPDLSSDFVKFITEVNFRIGFLSLEKQLPRRARMAS
jgi:hypothetical protein